MKCEKGQMLLLTGVTTIILFIATAYVSIDLSNINVEISHDESHPLYLEYVMVSEKFRDIYTPETFDEVRNRFIKIESSHNINFNAVYDDTGPTPQITIQLQDENTVISGTFDV